MIFRYPGGKSKKTIREKILKRFPANFSEYRDAMVGGGGIFFAINPLIKRWINDLDSNLISVYLALKNKPKEFIEECRKISDFDNLKDIFEKFSNNENADKALRYFFINRTVWGGRVNYKIKSRLYFSNPKGWNIINTNKLEAASSLIKNTKITCCDYEELLFQDGEDVLIYIDPPYYVNTNLSETSRLYSHNFEIEDHKRLNKLIKKSKHKIVISYDDNPFIRKLYKGFNFGKGMGKTHARSEKWKYCGTSSAKNQSKVKKEGKELIITNF